MLITRSGQLFFSVFTALSILMVIASYGDAQDERELLYHRKQAQLLEIATHLDAGLLTSFEEILAAEKAQNLNEEEQTLILNEQLEPIVMGVASQYPGFGLGYYSKRLDRNIVVGPRFDKSFLRKVNAPEALGIYETGKYKFINIENSIIWDGKPILALHFPIYRFGEIIGHIFVNSKIEDIEAAYKKGLIRRLIDACFIWVLVIGFVFSVFRRFKVGQARLIESIYTHGAKASADFPEFMPILDTINELRKQIEEKNHFIQWSLKQSKAGVVIVDNKGKIRFINDETCKYLGQEVEPSAIEGLDFATVFEASGVPTEKSLLIKTLQGNRFISERAMLPDGRVYHLNTTPIEDPQTGKITGAACHVIEITQYEEENQLYREVAQTLEQFIEICPLAIVHLDRDGRIVRLNRAMLEFYNEYLPYGVDYFVGRPIEEISKELGVNYEESFIAKVMKGEIVYNDNIMRLDRNWMVSGVPIYNPVTNEFSGALAIYNDITHFEKIKNDMARFECLKAIGETASSFAHELRNPTTTIRGFTQLLSKRCPEDYAKYFALILEEIDRMNEIIEEFLALSRSRLVEKTPCNINQIVNAIEPLLQADCIKNDIELKLSLMANDQEIKLNPKEMRQLILNIARNGIESMNAKGILTIATQTVESGVQLIISDSGCGIPPESIKKLFTPFYTSKVNGTGLGLAVCKNIVERHGGTIKVESVMGNGTTFIIFLPLA